MQTTIAGNKCASGTGEFFRQQLGRMDLRLEDLDEAALGARVLKISARCSVFMKSDCTHRLNKGEATRGDVALSLSKVMADKVGEFLIRAKVRKGAVVLVGGVTRNRSLSPVPEGRVAAHAVCRTSRGDVLRSVRRGAPLGRAGPAAAAAPPVGPRM